MPSSKPTRARIQTIGGRVTTVEEWLDLTAEEVAVIDMRIRLGEKLRERRRRAGLSQQRVARILGTSQGRVSKLEKGQASLDQLARSLLALGGSRREAARAIDG